ncbi:MAG TPA: hypothetical protein VHZ96_26245 [Frankiaceae bacterium]|jgi:hypothetical protein|nr:hypothetical protein [Frankiaceae bacterium]
MPDLAARLTRIDAAIACHRLARDAADATCQVGVYEAHEAEVDRLVALRVRVARGHGMVAG